jgi:hypothetical protein
VSRETVGFHLKPTRSVHILQNPSVISNFKFAERLSHSPADPSFSLRQAANDEAPKSGGIEPKYLGALGVFIFAALYDFFITHGGQPYLAHPPSL